MTANAAARLLAAVAGDNGMTTLPPSAPAIRQNQADAGSTSTAATTPARAASIFAPTIDPEQSIRMAIVSGASVPMPPPPVAGVMLTHGVHAGRAAGQERVVGDV